MAWTDSSRTALIEEVKSRPVLWDRTAQVDPNLRIQKHEALVQVVDFLNNAFYPHDSKTQYTVDEVRTQWKNLKDTYKRKQRWLTEGKYSRDPAEEPTWKFFRLLKFLEKNVDKIEDQNTNSNDGEQKPTTINGCATSPGSAHFVSSQPPSVEEHALAILLKGECDVTTETILARPAAPTSTPPQTPTPPPHETATPGTSNRKRPRASNTTPNPAPIHGSPVQQHSVQPNVTVHQNQDEWHHFGGLVSATLRRICTEKGRVQALRLQKKLSDVLYEAQMETM